MIPHLVLVGARPEIVGKMLGVPVAVSLINRTGTDDTFERKIGLRTFSADITDADALLACARQIHQWRPIDAMIGATEHTLLATAIAGEALGVRVNPFEAVRCAQDKAAMRKRLAEHGVETVAFRVCADEGDVREFLAEHPQGIILKPADGNGGRGVWLIRDPADVPAAWSHTARESSDVGVLAEELLVGIETSAETISADGEHRVLVIPAKETLGSPHFVEIAHEIPGGHPRGIARVAADAVLAALTAIGHAWGPAHTEVMVNGDRASVVEINPRWAGARYWEMIELATGVSMARASAMAFCYGELPTPWPSTRAHAVRLLAPSPGRIISITGVDQACGLDDVIRVGELNKIGDVVPTLTDFRGRTGYVLAAGPDPGAAKAKAREGAALISMQTVPAVSDRQGTQGMSDDVRHEMRNVLRSVRPDLDALVRIPSVSADPARAADVREAAEMTARLFREAGAQSAEVVDDVSGALPAVIASFPAPPDMPTVLLYAHYDVQPAGDLALWASPPFEPIELDRRLYGRGTADDKSGIAAHLAALRFFRGRPPVGVTVVVEGEEEIGSPGLNAFLGRYRHRLAADVIVLADSGNIAAGAPSLTVTLRGLVDCLVEVRTLDHGIHSGNFGGAAPDALTALCKLLATLHDDKGEVAVKGLHVSEAPDIDFPEERFRAEAGLLPGVQLLGDGDLPARLWAKPAISVLAIDAPSVANASNTLAASARAKISMRIAPGEDAVAALTRLTEHLHEHAPWGAQVEVTPGRAGQPYVIGTGGPAFQAARAAFSAAYGEPVTAIGQGGTIPFIAAFAAAFPAATILVSSAGCDPHARIHGADESLLLRDFENACVAEAVLLIELAQQNDKAQPARAI